MIENSAFACMIFQPHSIIAEPNSTLRVAFLRHVKNIPLAHVEIHTSFYIRDFK